MKSEGQGISFSVGFQKCCVLSTQNETTELNYIYLFQQHMQIYPGGREIQTTEFGV